MITSSATNRARETLSGAASEKATPNSAGQPWHAMLYKGLVLVEFAPGTVITPEMLLAINRHLNADPTKYRTTNLVCDLRNIIPSPETGYTAMMRLAGHFGSLKESWWKHQRSALVVASEVIYGLGRMYGALAEYNSGLQVEIFRNDLHAAIQWAQPSS